MVVSADRDDVRYEYGVSLGWSDVVLLVIGYGGSEDCHPNKLSLSKDLSPFDILRSWFPFSLSSTGY